MNTATEQRICPETTGVAEVLVPTRPVSPGTVIAGKCDACGGLWVLVGRDRTHLDHCHFDPDDLEPDVLERALRTAFARYGG
jgi:hypothetical protein